MDKEKLLYDLIFSKKEDFIIDISEYIDNIYEHKEFVDDIKNINYPIENTEKLQLINYNVGEKYNYHYEIPEERQKNINQIQSRYLDDNDYSIFQKIQSGFLYYSKSTKIK